MATTPYMRTALLKVVLGALLSIAASSDEGDKGHSLERHHDSEVDVASSGAVRPAKRIMRAVMAEAEGASFSDPLQELVSAAAASSDEVPFKGDSRDCVWHNWSPWSYCSQTCGNATKSRRRSIMIAADGAGQECDDHDYEVQACEQPMCAVDCQWGNWTDWSTCSVSCDKGIRQRDRPITVQGNSEGKGCNPQEGTETEECGSVACVHDCKWSQWTHWGSCSASCAGGVHTRSRSIEVMATHGGKKCQGSSRDEDVCNVMACPKDCMMSNWGSWEPCDATCGNGTKMRSRSVESLEAWGGKSCEGEFSESSPCFEAFCVIDCVWSEWSEWGACPVTCATDGANTSAKSTRNISIPAQNGGKACVNESIRFQKCNDIPCPQHCTWNDWQDWGSCSASCGNGTHSRLRTISRSAAYGGDACNGSDRQEQPCIEALCPVDCKLSDWIDWSSCSAECGSGKKVRWRWEKTPASRGGASCSEDTKVAAPCMGTDCVPTEDLIKNGSVTQVTGGFQVVTEDPVKFSGCPYANDIARKTVADFAKLPVSRIHVSMIPEKAFFGGGFEGAARDVNIWFSMLVPKTTDLQMVVTNLETHDLKDGGLLLRKRLRKVGILAYVNVSKIFVRMSQALKVQNVTPAVIAPKEPEWDNPNSVRLTGILKLQVSRPLRFAEDGNNSCAKQATESLLSELTGVVGKGVHTSLVPDHVFEQGSKEEYLTTQMLGARRSSSLLEDDTIEIPSDSVENISGGVNAWFAIAGGIESNRANATKKARALARALVREDLQAATERLHAYLKLNGCEVDSTVVSIMAKADGDTAWEGAPPVNGVAPEDVSINGVIEFTVMSPASFAADYRAEEGIIKALASLVRVQTENVQVSLVPSSAPPAIRQYDSKRPATPDEGWGDEVSAWFHILLPAAKPGERERIVALINGFSSDPGLASLKFQDGLSNEGIYARAEFVRVSIQEKDPDKDSFSPGVIKKIERGGDQGKTPEQLQDMADSTVVKSGESAPPSKVIAVVAPASAASSHSEPPVLSNPGGTDDENSGGDEEVDAGGGAGGLFAGLVEGGMLPKSATPALACQTMAVVLAMLCSIRGL
eukprot:TRINITY_DN19103_c0_g4_i1.p1 TRINITY_DN19103_c0_g4~~TRINITY_DN19103_c0_g4_i1.p1  ORF type:complete len:1089 (+),score=182.26 TRINITY_DN19103_c0_g4_i1:89-3355(+)